jgi:hypothetical protein
MNSVDQWRLGRSFSMAMDIYASMVHSSFFVIEIMLAPI